MEQYIYKLSLLKEWIELKVDWPLDRPFMTFEAYCSNRVDDPNYLKWARMFLASLVVVKPQKLKYSTPAIDFALFNQQRAMQNSSYQNLRNAVHNKQNLLGGLANMSFHMRQNLFGFSTSPFPWPFNY